MNLTPIETHGGIFVKRDDLFTHSGATGGKARACAAFLANHPSPAGLVTAASRESTQAPILARMAAALGVPCAIHYPSGAFTAEMDESFGLGAQLVQHKAGYGSVLRKRAEDDSALRRWLLVPQGMNFAEAVESTRLQVSSIANIAEDGRRPARIVVPVGSGMNLCGILRGLATLGLRIPVVGVRVGADPAKRLQAWTTPWERANLRLVESPTDYHAPAPDEWVYKFPTFVLDPHYEAKCVPFLQAGDLLWVVGVRASVPPF